MTADWPTDQPVPPPADDDGGPTIAAPRLPRRRRHPPTRHHRSTATASTAAPGVAAGSHLPQRVESGSLPSHRPGITPARAIPAVHPLRRRPRKPWRLIAGALLLVVILIGAAVFVFGDGATSEIQTPKPTRLTAPLPAPRPPVSEAPGTSGSGSAPPSPSPKSPPAGPATIDPAALPTLLESIPALNEKYKANLIPAADHLATKPFSGLHGQAGHLRRRAPARHRLRLRLRQLRRILRPDRHRRGDTHQSDAGRDLVRQRSQGHSGFNMNFTPWKDCAGTTVTGLKVEAHKRSTWAPWPKPTASRQFRCGASTSQSGAPTASCERAMTPRKERHRRRPGLRQAGCEVARGEPRQDHQPEGRRYTLTAHPNLMESSRSGPSPSQ